MTQNNQDWFNDLFIEESRRVMGSVSKTEYAKKIRSALASIGIQTSDIDTVEDLVDKIKTLDSTLNPGIDAVREALRSIGIEVGNNDTSGDLAEKIEECGFPIKFWNDKINTGLVSKLFMNCASLTTVPLFDTSDADDMRYMFHGCSSLTSVPLFDTAKVTHMDNMFYKCSSLTTVPAA